MNAARKLKLAWFQDMALDRTIEYHSVDGVERPVMTAAYDQAGRAVYVESVTSDIVRSIGGLFHLEEIPRIGSSLKESIPLGFRVQGNPLGERFLVAQAIDFDSISLQFPIHDFNPYIGLFKRHVIESGLASMPGKLPFAFHDEMRVLLTKLNACVDNIRLEGKSGPFCKRLNNFHRSSNKNYARFNKYINAWFDGCSRMCAIRIDLGYLKEPAKRFRTTADGQSVIVLPTHEEMAAERLRFYNEEVVPARVKFLKHVKNLPNRRLLAYVWKLEFGLDKYFHYHFYLLYHGSDVQEHLTLARMIGERYKNDITGGKGIYWNCNAHQELYKYRATGMIHHSDENARAGIRFVGGYMTKPDYYFKMVAPGNGRTFGMGAMPKPRLGEKTLGRPRLLKMP